MSAITYEQVLSLFEKHAEAFEKHAEAFEKHTKAFEKHTKAAERRSRDIDRRFEETDRQMKETAAQMKETDRKMQETAEQMRETDRRQKETDRQIKKLGEQIGGLGDKFGYFTEGLALPSMERILKEQFGMTAIAPRLRIRKNGEEMEIDVLAWANDDVELAVLVEVKSRVQRKAIQQLQKLMGRFREFFPEHRDKAVMGILAGVDWDRGVADKAREVGFLTAAIRDEMFEITAPDGFEARRW